MGSEPHRSIGLFLVMIPIWLLSSSSSQAFTFNVGGKDGWVVKPSEDYSHWAQRNRFQVNDTLLFKYKKGSDSVMVVKKEDYDSCNTKSPIRKMDDGDSSFSFDHSGPFFFISGNADNCQKGQKLIVVVMAVRKPADTPPSSVSPQPSEGPSPSGGISPAPSQSSSTRLGGSVGVTMGVGVVLILSSFAGLV